MASEPGGPGLNCDCPSVSRGTVTGHLALATPRGPHLEDGASHSHLWDR